MCSVTISGNIV